MKSANFLTGLRKPILFATLTLLIATPLNVSLAEPDNSVKQIKRSKYIKGNKVSKLAIIAAVKEKYKGRILTVRKRPPFYGKNCHHVKMIDTNGEFLLIKVACKNVKKKK